MAANPQVTATAARGPANGAAPRLTYGVAALARPTFDVPFAEQMKDQAFAALAAAGIDVIGPRELLFDREAAEKAVATITAAADGGRKIDALLILQVTFTDATMIVKLAKDVTAPRGIPLAIWALPEPRIGGRLRLNAYCGLNLAAHALGRAGAAHTWLYVDPAATADGASAAARAEQLRALAQPSSAAKRAPKSVRARAPRVTAEGEAAAERVLAKLRGSKITVVGKHPDGFDTCEYDDALLQQLAGMKVETVQLGTVFDKAKAADAARVAKVRAGAAAELHGLDEVNQEQLDKSFRVFCALQDVKNETGAKGMAVRCWPEMFTEYGCAACGPMAMMNQDRVPSACEADVNGSITQLMLQELAGEPAWMADLVDITPENDTAVLWHCGLAPLSMRDPEADAQATIHTNRKMPLLHQFPIKPGKVTLARLSRAKNEVKLMIASAEVVRAPMAFTGCSGTVKFAAPAGEVERAIIEEGLEHHFALAYGDHKPALEAIAKQWGLPVLELA
jgi:L-fucose isomerase-like protein